MTPCRGHRASTGSGGVLKGYLVRFWALTLSLATLIGLFVGAVSIDAEWIFVAVVGTAAVLAGGKPAAKVITNAIVRYRGYPQMAADLTLLKEQVQAAQGKARQLTEAAVKEYERGLLVGEERSTGASLGRRLDTMPRITGLTIFEDQVALIASYQDGQLPLPQTWLQVEVVGTGAVKGAVRVVKHDEEDRVVVLACCEETAPEYWRRLRDRAEDGEPPRNVRLRPYAAVDQAPGDYEVMPAPLEGE